jgi:hypothetical protein
MEASLRKCALEVFKDLDVNDSRGLEPEEINEWLVSVCGWTDEQVDQRLWRPGGIWCDVESVEFGRFLQAVVLFQLPVGDYDGAAAGARASKLAQDHHLATMEQAIDLKVLIKRAWDLPGLAAADEGGTDAYYCLVKVGPYSRQTDVKYRTSTPEWGSTFSFPILEPLAAGPPVRFQVMRHHWRHTHSLLGSVTVQPELLKHVLKAPRPDGRSAVTSMDFEMVRAGGGGASSQDKTPSRLGVEFWTESAYLCAPQVEVLPRRASPQRPAGGKERGMRGQSRAGSGVGTASSAPQAVTVVVVSVHSGRGLAVPTSGTPQHCSDDSWGRGDEAVAERGDEGRLVGSGRCSRYESAARRVRERRAAKRRERVLDELKPLLPVLSLKNPTPYPSKLPHPIPKDSLLSASRLESTPQDCSPQTPDPRPVTPNPKPQTLRTTGGGSGVWVRGAHVQRRESVEC